MSTDGISEQPRIGRAPVTSREELANVGLDLFFKRGFEETTVDDIAVAAGIGRRTFFRYFTSKNDVAWGDFDGLVDRMRRHLALVPADESVRTALRTAVLEFNRFPDSEVAHHRERMSLLLNVPALVGYSTLRFAAWRAAVAEFVATRIGGTAEDFVPRTVAWAYLAASIAAYEEWLHLPGADLADLLTATLDSLEGGLPALGPV